MGKPNLVREDILKLITSYFGKPTAETFLSFYGDETLPIFTEAAMKILGDFVGHDKAKAELEAIFIRNHMEHTYV